MDITILCKNRLEGLSPSSNHTAALPTTCFVDVILIPLPTWIGFSLLPILLFLGICHRKATYEPSTAHIRSRPPRTWCYMGLLTLYYLLIGGNILMLSIEIARLALINSGVGLIPFAYAGLMLSVLLFATDGLEGRIRYWQVINLIIWTGGIAMSVVQLVGLEQHLGIHGRVDTQYSVDDQIVDLAIMAGLYFVTAGIEVALRVWRTLRIEDAAEEGRVRAIEPGFPPRASGSEDPVMGFRQDGQKATPHSGAF